MSCTHTYDTIHLSAGSQRVCAHNLGPAIESDVVISTVSGVSDVTNDGVSTGELTIDNIQKNSVAYDDDEGKIIAIGKAVLWRISTSWTPTTTETSKTYKLKITAVLDKSPSETVVDYVYICFS